jgi:hypothetical protein
MKNDHMMSKRQAARLFEKTKRQEHYLKKKILLPDDFVFRVLSNVQNRLKDINAGKVKEDDKVRQMNILHAEMKVVNIELKKVMDNEKASN